MAERQDDRALSVGAAVRFSHDGRSIEGHIVRRQGRRRFAKVIDGEDRVWEVPEAALTPAPGARRGILLTRSDAARARWRLGDAVAFTGSDGPHRGRIVKFNPAYARVRSGWTTWNVPYALLGGGDDAGGAGDGAERLIRIAVMARGLMDENGLTDWTFAFFEAERRLGDCNYTDRTIRLGRAHVLEGSDAEIRDTVLHEIAHALAGPEVHHGPAWKAIAQRLGATPRANVYERTGR